MINLYSHPNLTNRPFVNTKHKNRAVIKFLTVLPVSIWTVFTLFLI